jgi:hypothetical protein
LLALVTACAPKAVMTANESAKQADNYGIAPASPPMAEGAGAREAEQPRGDAASGSAAASSSAEDMARMIVRTVSLSILVDNTDATLAYVTTVIEQYKGYVAESNRWIADNQVFANVTIRVPADSLEAVRAALRSQAIRVESETMSGQDVTEEYVDLGARLRNLEATEKELLALMTEIRENRGKAEDILAVHRELTQIRSEIESLKGRMQYLERSAALATINLTIRPKESPTPVLERARWSPLVTLSKALRGFVSFLQVMADLLIYLLIFSPVVLVPILVIWLLARAIRRRKAKKSQAG